VGFYELEGFVTIACAQAQIARVAERHAHHVSNRVVVFRDHDLFEEHRIDPLIPHGKPDSWSIRP